MECILNGSACIAGRIENSFDRLLQAILDRLQPFLLCDQIDCCLIRHIRVLSFHVSSPDHRDDDHAGRALRMRVLGVLDNGVLIDEGLISVTKIEAARLELGL
jgi:hypothetical protein